MQNTRVWARACGLTRAVVEGVQVDETDGSVIVSARPNAKARGRCGRCQRRSPGYDQGFHGHEPLIALALLSLGSHPPVLPGRN